AAADQVGAIRQRPDLEVERRQLGLGFAQPLGLRRFCRCRSAFTTACDGDDREHCGYDETGPDGQNATHVHVAPGWARGDRALSGVPLLCWRAMTPAPPHRVRMTRRIPRLHPRATNPTPTPGTP